MIKLFEGMGRLKNNFCRIRANCVVWFYQLENPRENKLSSNNFHPFLSGVFLRENQFYLKTKFQRNYQSHGKKYRTIQTRLPNNLFHEKYQWSISQNLRIPMIEFNLSFSSPEFSSNKMKKIPSRSQVADPLVNRLSGIDFTQGSVTWARNMNMQTRIQFNSILFF